MGLLGILQHLGNLQLLGILLGLLGILQRLVVLLLFEHIPSTLLGGRHLQGLSICSCILRFQHFGLHQSTSMSPQQALQVISSLQHWICQLTSHLWLCSWWSMQSIPMSSWPQFSIWFSRLLTWISQPLWPTFQYRPLRVYPYHLWLWFCWSSLLPYPQHECSWYHSHQHQKWLQFMVLLLVLGQFHLSWIGRACGNLWSFISHLHRLKWGLLVSYQHMLWRFMISLLGWLCFLESKQSWLLLQSQYLMRGVQHQVVISLWLIHWLIL